MLPQIIYYLKDIHKISRIETHWLLDFDNGDRYKYNHESRGALTIFPWYP